MAHESFDGLRVLSLESRRGIEVAKLIRTYGGEPFVVPSMREVPLESNQAALEFADELMAGKSDLVFFFAGVGVRALLDIVETRYSRESFLAALRNVKVAAPGPKPQAALREVKIPVVVTAVEPSTWREMMKALETTFGDSLGEMRVGVQEYGASNPEFLSVLSERCREVTKVPVYQWALPEDIRPLRECVLGIVNGYVDVVLFMTAVQAIHLFQVAEQMNCQGDLRGGLKKMVVISIGPTTSEELELYGIKPDFEPSRPKMGFLVNEAAQYSGKVLQQKRNGDSADADTAQSKVGLTTRVEMLTPASASSAVAREPVWRVAPSTPTMAGFRDGLTPIDFLHEISSRIAAADSFHMVLGRIVDFVTTIIALSMFWKSRS